MNSDRNEVLGFEEIVGDILNLLTIHSDRLLHQFDLEGLRTIEILLAHQLNSVALVLVIEERVGKIVHLLFHHLGGLGITFLCLLGHHIRSPQDLSIKNTLLEFQPLKGDRCQLPSVLQANDLQWDLHAALIDLGFHTHSFNGAPGIHSARIFKIVIDDLVCGLCLKGCPSRHEDDGQKNAVFLHHLFFDCTKIHSKPEQTQRGRGP